MATINDRNQSTFSIFADLGWGLIRIAVGFWLIGLVIAKLWIMLVIGLVLSVLIGGAVTWIRAQSRPW